MPHSSMMLSRRRIQTYIHTYMYAFGIQEYKITPSINVTVGLYIYKINPIVKSKRNRRLIHNLTIDQWRWKFDHPGQQGIFPRFPTPMKTFPPNLSVEIIRRLCHLWAGFALPGNLLTIVWGEAESESLVLFGDLCVCVYVTVCVCLCVCDYVTPIWEDMYIYIYIYMQIYCMCVCNDICILCMGVYHHFECRYKDARVFDTNLRRSFLMAKSSDMRMVLVHLHTHICMYMHKNYLA